MRECVNCHKHRKGRTYTFHVGVVTGRTVSHQVGSTTTTTQYRLFDAQEGHLCTICAVRYLVVRFFGPLLLCVGLEVGGFYGFEALGIQLGTDTVPWVLLGALVMQAIAVPVVWTTIAWQNDTKGSVGCLAGASGMGAMFGAFLSFVGGIMVLGLATDLSDDKHSLFGDYDPHMSEFNGWLVGIIIGCQLIIYLNVWAGRQLLLEGKVWRCRRRALRAQLGEPKLVGFTTAKYRTLRQR